MCRTLHGRCDIAATTAGAIKAYLEQQGLGVPCFRDAAPDGQDYPYVTITEEVSLTVNTRAQAYSELAQVDLWQRMRHPAGHPDAGKVAEDPALVRALQRALRGATLLAAPTLTFWALLEGSVRLPEPDNNVVHHACTVRVHRDLEE